METLIEIMELTYFLSNMGLASKEEIQLLIDEIEPEIFSGKFPIEEMLQGTYYLEKLKSMIN